METELKDIAIIGVSCEFPGAESVDEFWENLTQGKVSISRIPDERWENSKYLQGKKGDRYKIYCPTGGFIKNIHAFDYGYFGMDEEEALVLDAHQKLMLMLAKHVFDDAGYGKQEIYGEDISIYMAASQSGNTELIGTQARFQQVGEVESEKLYKKFGEKVWHTNMIADAIVNLIPGRISHEFNLKGASVLVDTACSSSLVALHEACHALRRGESKMSICGGVFLHVTPATYYAFSAAGALSERGILAAFDEEADGFVPGEGGGMVLLKRLEDALNDHDYIYGVIKGSIINNDGHTIGIMSPNPNGQRHVIEKFYEESEIKPTDLKYVEAHGTGTKIGDLSEFSSLSNAFKKWNLENGSIYMGSCKANIGHTISASGIASLIKILGMMKQDRIYPQVNYKNPNKKINFNKSSFKITDKCVENYHIDYAAINSFGFGGTNAHVVIENGQKYNKEDKQETLTSYPVIIGAHCEASLRQKREQICRETEKPEFNLHDFVLSNNHISQEYDYVISGIVKDRESLKALAHLEDFSLRSQKKMMFLFTGQGSQYIRMGWEIYKSFPAFRNIFDYCAEQFKRYMQKDIRRLLYENDDPKEILPTQITQAIVFSIDYSIGKMLLDAGCKPSYLIGHSIGEWVAAALAEVLTLDEIIEIVSYRGMVMADMNGKGKMVAVYSSDRKQMDEIASSCQVFISCDNGSHMVIGGENEKIGCFLKELSVRKILYKELKVASAFHTGLFEHTSVKFEEFLKKYVFRKPKIDIIGNRFGKVVEQYTSKYWADHLTHTVEFTKSIAFAKEQNVEVLVECGGGSTLIHMAKSQALFDEIFFLSPKDSSIDLFYKGLLKVQEWNRHFELAKCFEGIPYKKYHMVYPFTLSVSAMLPFYHNSWIHRWNWELINETGLEVFSGGIDISGILRKSVNKSEIENKVQELLSKYKDGTVIIQMDALATEWKKEQVEGIYEKAIGILAAVQKMAEQKVNMVFVLNSGKDKAYRYAITASITTFLMSLCNQIANIKKTGVIISDSKNWRTVKFADKSWVKEENGQFYIRNIVPQEMEEEMQKDSFRVVMILGGLGSIGMRITKMLLENTESMIILTGRREIDDAIQNRINIEFGSAKSRVSYVSCDVTDVEAFEKIVVQVETEYGNIDAVFHLAGCLNEKLVCTIDSDFKDAWKVLEPKVIGTMVMDQVFAKRNLKLMVLLSSISATDSRWSLGLADYAAANAFLDYYCETQKNRVIAFNYTLWDVENGIDNGVESAISENVFEMSGLKKISAEDAIDSMKEVIFRPSSKGVYHIFQEQPKKQSVKEPVQGQKTVEKKNEKVIQAAKCTIENLKDVLYKVISKHTREEITLDNEDENFLNIGLDSVKAIQLIESLKVELGITVYPTIVFEYQTPIELYQYIKENCMQTEKVEKEAEIREIIKSQEEDDIAIVAFQLEVSGCENKIEFWNKLTHGETTVSKIPSSHFANSNITEEYKGGYIEDIYEFDPLFFGISPKEAKCVDPQQRKFLQLTYQALQEAGYVNQNAEKKIGVYVGAEQSTYGEQFMLARLMEKVEKRLEGNSDIQDIMKVMGASKMSSDAVIGNSLNEIATRISYTFGFTGPSLVLNTACSSSLVALSMAVKDLKLGNIQGAVVGGVNFNLTEVPFLSMKQLNAISGSGNCRPFDESADGMMLGEAVVSIVIKRLGDAKRDGNYVFGVVKDIEVNNNGYSQGLTVPTVQGQQEVIEKVAARNSDVYEKLRYIETHGTGTPLGDPIEVSSILNVYRNKLKATCYLGSYKGNFGHPLASSGLVSIVKGLKILETHTIPQIAGFKEQNPHMESLKQAGFKLADRMISIDPREDFYVGIDAFGFGGTNVHVLLGGYKNENGEKKEFPQVVLLSHYSMAMLKQYAGHIRKVITEENCFEILRIVNCESKNFAYKAAFVAESYEELENKLARVQNGVLDEDIIMARQKTKGTMVTMEIECANSSGIVQLLKNICQGKLTEGGSDAMVKKEDVVSMHSLLACVARLYCEGNELDLRCFYQNLRVPLEQSIVQFDNKEYRAVIRSEDFELGKNQNTFNEITYQNRVSDSFREKLSKKVRGEF